MTIMMKTAIHAIFMMCIIFLSVSNGVAAGVNYTKIDPLEKSLSAYNKGDYKTAYDYTIPLVSIGNPSAQNLLGMMYELGKGVPQDAERSVVLYRQAADKGNIYAQFNLAVSYEMGNGMPQNYHEAVKWYQRAAEQGASFAQYNLAIMYEQGRGTEKNYKEAAYWYKKAALQGYRKAQNNLAYLYESGKGVKQDIVTAFILFDIVAEKGDESAMNKRDYLKPRMSDEQLKQAEVSAKNYKTIIGKDLK